jgi:phospholipid/cholesterol/gamma-HCH transport system ATP-binding protein
MKILLGLTPADQGAARLFDVNMMTASESEKQQLLKQVGVAFQQGALFDYLTVADNLKFAMENMTDFDEARQEKIVTDLLEAVKLTRTRNMYPYELSGGMQRRVGVARALATSPQLAIFDEPTAGLDPVTSTIILNMINRLVDLGDQRSMIVITSSVEIGIRFAERVIVINDGKVLGDGLWKDLLLYGDPWVQNFLGVRLKGIDINYAFELGLPELFIKQHIAKNK